MSVSKTLAATELLGSFDQGDLDTLETQLSIAEFPDGHVFAEQGAPGDSVFMILEGQVLVTRTHEGQDTPAVMGTLGPSEMFGLVALVADVPRSATCTARGPVLVASLSRGEFETLRQRHSALALRFRYRLAKQLARDARRMNRRVLGFAIAQRDDLQPGQIEAGLHVLGHREEE